MAAKQEERASLFELASSKLSEAQKFMAEARELLKEDFDNARQEKSAIEKIIKTLNQVHFASTVVLNVGGKIYKTTLDTLRKDPDSMLCAMFSGRFELKEDAVDGAYFIDRDGKLFRYILNFLRDGNLRCPNDKTVRKDLLAEAEFYQVQGIISQLQSPLGGSLIITSENHYSALMSWLPPETTCSLLYRFSTDGQTAADFHRCCDNKGPTLVVIKSGEYIYGGYTSQSWESAIPITAIKDSQCFLFTLVSPSGNEPVKMEPKPDGARQCHSVMGPSFGSSTSKYDLRVINKDGQINLCYFDLGYGFICPVNFNKTTFFTGKNPSEISELEVFRVDL